MMFRQPQNSDLPLWAEKVQRIAEASPDPDLKILISAHLLLYHTWWTGRQARAGLLLDTVGPSVRPEKIEPLTYITWHAFEAAHHWMTADNNGCHRSVKAGLEAAEASGIHIWDFVLLAQQTWAITGSGREAISKHLRSMDFVMASNRRIDIFYYHYLLGWEALCLSQLVRAEEYMRTALTQVKGTGIAAPFGVAFTLMGLAEVLIESGRYDEAEGHLRDARELGLSMNCKTVEYQYLWIQSLLCLKRGDDTSAMQYLGSHLAVSRKYGILNHPCWRAPVMARLYAKALESEIETDQARLLIRKHRLSPVRPPETDRWPYPVKIYTLGNFTILLDDEPVDFGGKGQRKPLTMLKALIALGGREVSENRLSDMLWPDADGDSAHKSFEITLLRLRRLLRKEGALQFKGGTLSLDPRCCWVDVWLLDEVEKTHGEWSRSAGGGAASAATMRLWEKAIALYSGHFLESDAPQPWTSGMREKTRGIVLRLIAALGRQHENAAEWEMAAERYQKGIAIDDLAEEFYRRLMGCLDRLGRNAEAARVYRACASALSGSLGIEPSEKTTAAYNAIRSR